jgi:hypothetical protein
MSTPIAFHFENYVRNFGVDTFCLIGPLLAWFSRKENYLSSAKNTVMVFLGKKEKKMNAANRIFLRMKRKMADVGVCQTLMIYLAEMHL